MIRFRRAATNVQWGGGGVSGIWGTYPIRQRLEVGEQRL